MFASALLITGVAYLSGSLSSAMIISKLFRLPDPRLFGSQNPGATNVYRLGGKLPAILVLLFDVLKGLIPVYLALYCELSVLALGVVSIAACLGHSFPLYFGFKGGKAVATALGALLALGASIAAGLICTWLVIVVVTGYSSLGAIIATLFAPLFSYLFHPEYTLAVAMLSTLILIRHYPNVRRLISQQEPKLWQKPNRSQTQQE